MAGFPRGAQTDPLGTGEGVEHVVRGNSWAMDWGTVDDLARISVRTTLTTTVAMDKVGFRCARSLP